MQQSIRASGIIVFIAYLGLLTLFLPPIFLPIMGSVFTLYIGEIFLLLLSFFCILSIVRRGELRTNKIIRILFGFLVISSLSILTADNIGRYLIGFTTYFETFLILLIFFNFNFNKVQQTNMMNYYLYSGIILSLWIIQKTIFENHGDFIIGNKIALDIGSSNYLASILMIPFYIFYTILLREGSAFTSKKKIKSFIGLIFIGAAIIYTGSRTCLGIIGVLTFIYVLKDVVLTKQGLTKTIVSLILIGAFVIGLYIFAGDFINQMVNEGRFDNLRNQSNLLERGVIFQEYFNAFLQSPIFGNGFNNVNALNQYYLAHNFILQVLGDNGIITCALFLIFILSVLIFLRKGIRDSKNIELNIFMLGYKRGFYAVLLHGLLEPNFGTKLFMIYLFLGLAIIISCVNTEIADKHS
ncbi:O-antigen ligase family protein [Bacillus toyonensis]|uniref:O-antigen ligase family protein n=1 Tax=Bacillus toyonensis TaxID=155322 RepID=UPI0025408D65|nr:O-antigen ligase family protein [Bacillus toyonensis]WIG36679.1 O-antigen ligase family protein [Bacillus toyonensis]